MTERLVPFSFLMGRTLEEILMSRDTLVFLLQHLGFMIYKKISSENVPANRTFRPKYRYPCPDFCTNKEKDEKGHFEISESSFLLSSHCFGISQTYLHWFTTTVTNTITNPGVFISGRYIIKQCVKIGTSLVGGKFKLKQCKIT